MSESRCPNCGAALPKDGGACPFCAEAQRLLAQLAQRDEIRLCARCGEILDEGEDDLCSKCRMAMPAPPRIFARRDDRIAGWIRDHLVEPAPERQGVVCPTCGQPVLPLAVFCSQCGQRLVGQRTGEAVLPPALEASAPPLEAPAVEPLAAGPAVEGLLVGPGGEEETPPSLPAQETGQEPVEQVLHAWWQQFVEVWREQFGAGRPTPETESRPPWWQGALERLKSWRLPEGRGRISTVLWLVLGALLLGLVLLAIFWMQLVGSGAVTFR